jgi:hypothetical protein
LEKFVPVSVEEVAEIVEPFTRQAYVAETLSPSVSLAPAGVQVRVSDSVGEVGLRLTLVYDGALLPMVTEEDETALPLDVPSLGVTEQRITSDLLWLAGPRVEPVAEIVEPFTVQA